MEDLTSWLGELVHQVDSSLLDEWEQLTSPNPEPTAHRAQPADPAAHRQHRRAFTVLVRNAMFRRVELAAHRRYHELGELDAGSGWDAEAWQDALIDYYAEYDRIGIGPAARGPAFFQLRTEPERWLVRQIFDDPADDHDWAISAKVDLAASDEAGEAIIDLVAVGPA